MATFPSYYILDAKQITPEIGMERVQGDSSFPGWTDLIDYK